MVGYIFFRAISLLYVATTSTCSRAYIRHHLSGAPKELHGSTRGPSKNFIIENFKSPHLVQLPVADHWEAVGGTRDPLRGVMVENGFRQVSGENINVELVFIVGVYGRIETYCQSQNAKSSETLFA